jgi:saccharopine dehydrogenase-like NADP-dependent oxidoreductase
VTVRLDLVRAIAAADLVISLVPYTFHAGIIEVAIANKTHVVTTSYASPAIRAHEQGAKDAGVILVNEVGVDPGVDHLYAIKAIDEIHSQGGQVSVSGRNYAREMTHSLRSKNFFPSAEVYQLPSPWTIRWV